MPTGLRELTATRPPLCYQLALPSPEEERDVMLTMPLDFVPPAGVSVILAISRLLYCTLPFFPTPISRRGIAALASCPCSYLHTLSTSDGDGNSCYGKGILYIHVFPSFSFSRYFFTSKISLSNIPLFNPFHFYSNLSCVYPIDLSALPVFSSLYQSARTPARRRRLSHRLRHDYSDLSSNYLLTLPLQHDEPEDGLRFHGCLGQDLGRL